jgi:protein gp37
MNRTKIEYLSHTWNPIVMRCRPVSRGCDNCWHLRMADRLKANPALSEAQRAAYAGGEPALNKNEIDAPLRLRKPGVIGVQFMGDLFHEDVTDDMRIEVFTTFCEPDLFIVLTKRPENMKRFIEGPLRGYYSQCPAGNYLFPNLYCGVSIEDQRTANERIPVLMETPAINRIVSLEPTLGPVRFNEYPDWLIMGCESGPGARPMHREWALHVARQCETHSIPLFYKQGPGDNGYYGKMPTLNGRVYDQVPWGTAERSS